MLSFRAGGDIGMRAGIDVRVDSQGNRRNATQLPGDVVDAIEFRFRLDIETADAGLQRLPDLAPVFARPGKNRLLRGAAGGEHAFELAPGNNVETTAKPRQHVQHREIGIGFHGEANEAVKRTQRFAIDPEMAFQRRPRVNETGCANASRDFANRDIFGEQFRAAIAEMVHG